MIPPPLSQGDAQGSAFVYLLRSARDGSFYTGWTTDVLRRLEAHNMGVVPSTKCKRPFHLVGYETHPTIESAVKRERQLKNSPNLQYKFKKRILNHHAAPLGAKEGVG